jgi:hypothetical protein
LAVLTAAAPAYAGQAPHTLGAAAAVVRRHLLPEDMEPTILATLRHASAVHASSILPLLSADAPLKAPAMPSGGSLTLQGEAAIALERSTAPTPLLEAMLLLLPPLYLQIRTCADERQGLAKADRYAYEPLVAAAAVVDKIVGGAGAAGDEKPSMVATLQRFFDGGFGGGRAGAAQLLSSAASPLFAAFLPSHSHFVAQTLTRLLQSGPLAWEEPLFLLVAYALQHPDAPKFVDHFHVAVQRCVEGDSDANVYCLSSAMRAAARAGDNLSSQALASGKPFDEVASLDFYASEERELEATRDVVPAMAQALAAMAPPA